MSSAPQERRLHQNLDLVLLVLARRVVFSLFGVAIVLGAMVIGGYPWWARAATGAAYVGVVIALARPLHRELPRGVTRWGRGILRRISWRGRYLLGLLALVSVSVGTMAFAPLDAATVAAGALILVLQVGGFVVVMGWIVGAVVNLVRGR